MAQLIPNYKLKFVQRDDLEYVWPLVEEYIKAGVSMCYSLDIDFLKSLLDEQKAGLWVIEDKEIHGAGISGVTEVKEGLMMEILALGGEHIDLWIDETLPIFEADAKQMGCTYIQITGRQGWKRMLKSFGYDQTSVILGKKL